MQLLLKNVNFTNEINEEWIKENCFIAGGACVSNFTRQPIHDIDLYFKTKEARDYFIEHIGENKYLKKDEELYLNLIDYENRLNCNNIQFGDEIEYKDIIISTHERGTDEKVKYFVINFGRCENIWISFPLFQKQKWMFENGYDYVVLEFNHYEVDHERFLGNKSITIKHNNGLIYQFILRFYGEPNEVLNSTFDFQHCKIAYDLKTNQYIASQETWQCLSLREIKYVNSFYPISSLKRLYKYAGRGFKYNNDEFVKIIKDIHEVDVSNKFVLEDQLVGYYEDFDYNDVFEIEYI